MSETHHGDTHSPNPLIKDVYKQTEQLLRNIDETGDEERLSPAERLQMANEQLVGLSRKLAEGIRNNQWQILIGEDVSGRIPALFIYELIKRYNSSNNISPPQLFFLASGKNVVVEGERVAQENVEDLAEYVKAHRELARGKRALYITDVVHSGESLQKSAIALGVNGIHFDIASLDSHISSSVTNSLGLKESKLYTGTMVDAEQLGNLYTGFGGKPALRAAVGVEKNGNEPTTRATYQDTAAVNDLRAQIKTMANEAYTTIFANQN